MNNFPAAIRPVLFAVCCSLLAVLPRLFAEENKPTAAPPAPPFVRNAPSQVTWTIEFKKRGETAGRKGDEAAPKTGRATLQKIEVTKYGRDRREVEEWSDGSKVEKWFFRGYHIFEQHGSKDIYVVNSSADGFQRLTFPDYSTGDFPELEWLSAESYVGEESFEGRPGFLFEQSAPVLSEPVIAQIRAATGTAPVKNDHGDSRRKTRVWIDEKTRLPMAVDNGVKTKVYSFRTSAQTVAEPPAAFVKALQEYEKSRAVLPSR